jgi:hypothetical protein
MKESILLESKIHESGLDAWFYVCDAALVDVSDVRLSGFALNEELLQPIVVEDANAALGAGRDIDHHLPGADRFDDRFVLGHLDVFGALQFDRGSAVVTVLVLDIFNVVVNLREFALQGPWGPFAECRDRGGFWWNLGPAATPSTPSPPPPSLRFTVP